jgi:hypothetical protein
MLGLSLGGAMGGPGQNLLGPNYKFRQESGPAVPPPASLTLLTTQGCHMSYFTGAAKV